MFYLLGFVCLINFLTPILVLFTSRFPWRVDISEFAIFIIPIILQTFIIRHYVQKWVFEETERGFHTVGGLLFISSWWIHCVGVLFAIFRIPVPYLPTPKDHLTGSDYRLHLPNIFLIVASVIAIVYGLQTDWNPYTLFMAGFAMTNIIILLMGVIMTFPLSFSQDTFFTQFFRRPLVSAKSFLWHFRHAGYQIIRRNALLFCLFSCVGAILIVTSSTKEKPLQVKKTGPSPVLTGLTFINSQPDALENIDDYSDSTDSFSDSLISLI